jgi:hypothetical protein
MHPHTPPTAAICRRLQRLHGSTATDYQSQALRIRSKALACLSPCSSEHSYREYQECE